MPPMPGRMRRIGASAGVQIRCSTPTTGLYPLGENQLSRAQATTASR